MKRRIALVICLLLPCLLLAVSVNVPVVATDSTRQTESPDSAVVKVPGKGTGTDKVAALKDALRDAVERAVGMFVDAEQLMKNDDLISDQILTMSNAYVTKYDVVKESTANGIVTVKILAEVKKTALAKKIMDVMPTQKIDIGSSSQNLFANVVSKDKRDKDGVAILKNFFKDKNPGKQLVRVTLGSPEPRVVKNNANSDTLTLGYLFKAEIDREKYMKEFLPQLTEVLGQLSVVPARKTRLKKHEWWDLKNAERSLAQYKATGVRESRVNDCAGMLGTPFFLGGGLSFGDGDLVDVVYAPSRAICFDLRLSPPLEGSAPGRINDMMSGMRNNRTRLPIRVVSSFNGSKSSVACMDYLLENNVWPVVIEWLKTWRLPDIQRPFQQTSKILKYNIVFRDDGNGEVAAFPCELSVAAVANFEVCMTQRLRTYVYITPFIQNAADAYYVWWNFELAKDDLAKIKSIDIELAE